MPEYITGSVRTDADVAAAEAVGAEVSVVDTTPAADAPRAAKTAATPMTLFNLFPPGKQ
jgi:hypothetical protein